MNLALIGVVLIGGAVTFSDDVGTTFKAVHRIAAPGVPSVRAPLLGTPARYWVFFSDKAVADDALQLALDQRRNELSARALQRRALRRTAPGLLDVHDIAVPQRYVDAVAACGARVRRVSRWLNAVSVEATSDQLRAIAALPFVRGVRPLARSAGPLPRPETSPPDAGNGFDPRGVDPVFEGAAFDQLDQVGVVAAHTAGYTGAGVIIGILDTGFRRTHDAFNQTASPAHAVQVLAEYDFVDDDPVTAPEAEDHPDQHVHGTLILGVLGANYPFVLVGAAYDATFILAKTEDITQEVPLEEDQYVAGLEFIEALGGDVATSSLGYIDWYTQADLDGQTAVTTIAVNVATANGVVCCTAAGNYGHDEDPATARLIAPADAFRVLTCGSVRSTGVISGFSSDGPSADGRVKPEVLARGTSTVTVDPYGDVSLVTASGTSLSTPVVAGVAALVVQAHPDWTVDKVRRALFHTANDFLANADYDATYVRGYGIVSAMEAILFVHSDINGDDLADGDDIAPFMSALAGLNADADQRRRADVNADGVVDTADVPVFVADLLGG